MLFHDAEPIVTALTIAAGGALGVERCLEYLKVIVDRGYGTSGSDHGAKNRLDRVNNLRREVDQAIARRTKKPSASPIPATSANTASPLATAQTDSEDPANEPEETFAPPALPVIAATPYSQTDTAKKLFLQLSAAALGIVFAQLLGLRLMAVFINTGPSAYVNLMDFLDVIVTGLVIGGGSQPIHVIIRFITERKVPAAEATATTSATPTTPVAGKALSNQILASALVEATEAAPQLWLPFHYQGGVDAGKLEHRHLRTVAPDLIVYHHTAASSNASFAHIVEEITVKKGWLTGYHCVVMPDGELKHFCRWDRYGNHAKGVNLRSLGVAFQGNFHTASEDAYANADGRYGNQRPTAAQLDAGARLIALWARLYSAIALDFDHHILPHSQAKSGHTVCPGCNFPHAELQRLVVHYDRAWANDAHALDQIEKIKQQPYIYADGVVK